MTDDLESQVIAELTSRNGLTGEPRPNPKPTFEGVEYRPEKKEPEKMDKLYSKRAVHWLKDYGGMF